MNEAEIIFLEGKLCDLKEQAAALAKIIIDLEMEIKIKKAENKK